MSAWSLGSPHRRQSARALLAVAALQALAAPVRASAPPVPTSPLPVAASARTDPAAATPAGVPAADAADTTGSPAGAAVTAGTAGPLGGSSSAPAPADAAAGLERLRGAQRSATAAIVMSIPWPGWGQLYADAPLWGAIAFGAQMYYLGNILMESRRVQRQRTARDLEPPESAPRRERDLLVAEHRERARDFVWWAAGAALLISLDAYVSISLVDFDDPGKPVPDLGTAPGAGGDGAAAALTLSWRF